MKILKYNKIDLYSLYNNCIIKNHWQKMVVRLWYSKKTKKYTIIAKCLLYYQTLLEDK